MTILLVRRCPDCGKDIGGEYDVRRAPVHRCYGVTRSEGRTTMTESPNKWVILEQENVTLRAENERLREVEREALE